MALAAHIQQRAMTLRDDVIAVAVYGSTARGDDGPYSDLEMMIVVEEADTDFSHEWTAGAWKAEVNFLGHDVALDDASELDGDWAMTKGQFAFALPMHDPEDIFTSLRKAVFAHPAEAFNTCIREVIVGEIYELVGKWRNMRATRDFSYLPICTVKLAQYGACALGLAHHTLYSTSARMLHESLQLPNRPAGYDALCQCVLRGMLHEPLVLMGLCEVFWRGLVTWAEAHGIALVTDPMGLNSNE
jgi:kanamycin nucleotidyltransferase